MKRQRLLKRGKQKEVADVKKKTGFLLQEENFEPTATDPAVENDDNEEEEGEGLKLNFIPGICVKISWGGIIAC